MFTRTDVDKVVSNVDADIRAEGVWGKDIDKAGVDSVVFDEEALSEEIRAKLFCAEEKPVIGGE